MVLILERETMARMRRYVVKQKNNGDTTYSLTKFVKIAIERLLDEVSPKKTET